MNRIQLTASSGGLAVAVAMLAVGGAAIGSTQSAPQAVENTAAQSTPLRAPAPVNTTSPGNPGFVLAAPAPVTPALADRVDQAQATAALTAEKPGAQLASPTDTGASPRQSRAEPRRDQRERTQERDDRD